ncbi:MAG: UDP-N-acetylmuramoyl-L-alanyl-D-glutamate--2,6-diaminopimelate ligase [Pseudomonadota bacterium]
MMAATRTASNPLLAELLSGFVASAPLPSLEVSGLTQDSRQITSGDVFVALPGATHHGLDFLDSVLSLGVAAVLLDEDDSRASDEACKAIESSGACAIVVPKLASRLGEIASRFYGAPSKNLSMAGITGTDGKTSVSQFVAHARADLEGKAAVIGTLGNGIAGELHDVGLTTPDTVTLHSTLAQFVYDDVRSVAMEVSSHAIDQHRVAGVEFDVVVLTNLGRDHLDYHGTVEAYHQAKLALMQHPAARQIVVNLNDPGVSAQLHTLDGQRLMCFSSDPAHNGCVDVYADNICLSANGIVFEIVSDGNRWPLKTKLVGRFNVDNLLAAFCTLKAFEFTERDIVGALSRLHAVPGRAECFSVPGRARAVVDYSHTPQALRAILESVREHCEGRLWCVFGCGGDRDPGKRPMMAAAAEALADRVVVTDDNPRTEDGDAIVADIVAGFRDAEQVQVQRDRRRAIALAMSMSRAQDWVVVAGKGHEDYQIIGEEKFPLSDREIVADAMLEHPDA